MLDLGGEGEAEGILRTSALCTQRSWSFVKKSTTSPTMWVLATKPNMPAMLPAAWPVTLVAGTWLTSHRVPSPWNNTRPCLVPRKVQFTVMATWKCLAYPHAARFHYRRQGPPVGGAPFLVWGSWPAALTCNECRA